MANAKSRSSATVTALIFLLLCGCGGGGGGADRGGSGTPSGPLPIVSLTATPELIFSGSGAALTWTSEGASSCTASGDWKGSRGTSGSELIPQLFDTSTYTLTCSNGQRQAASSATVIVDGPPPISLPTLTFTVSPSLVRRGDPVTLTWSSSNIDWCHAGWVLAGDASRPVQGTEVLTDITQEGLGRTFDISCGNDDSVNLRRYATVRIYSFSGSLIVPGGISADSDVNNPDADYTFNDDDGIPISSVSLVPGYVNQPMTGPPGRSYEAGDIIDLFRVTLQQGQLVRLLLPSVDMTRPPAERDDADLYIYDSNRNLVDASVSLDALETLRIEAEDSYYVEVRAVTGGFNYLLSLEPATSMQPSNASRVSASFVPGEAIVKLKSSTIRAQSKLSSSAWVAKSLPGATHKRGGVDQELLVSLPPQASNATPLRKSSRAASENEPQNGTDDLRQRKLATLLQVKDLAKLPNVHDASANRILEAQGIPTDPLFSHQRWNFELANLPAAWDITTGSSDVTIAIVDSGAVRNHPDLESQFVDGYDVVDRDPDFADTHPNHGTHVAGIVGAIANNANGGAGVAWGSRLMPVRVLDEIGGSLYDVLQGVRYAAGLPNDLGVSPSRPADIINLSLGIALECSVAEAELFEQVLAAGIHLVAAAGNYQTNSAFAPAACPGVIGVASVGPGGERAPYSNFGARVDLAAPGGDIRFDRDTDGMLDGVLSTGATLLGEHTYVSMQGTSMAAPHVSGILALMKSINPTLSPLQVQQLIETGLLTDDVGEPGPDELGYGNINALKALRAAAGEFEVPASIRLLPGVLNFRNFDTELTFSVTNAGLAPLTVNQVRSMSANVAVEPLVVNAFGLGSYRAIALRDELELGTTHNGVIEVHSNIGVRELPVLVNHSIFNSSSRPGRLYLVVTEAASGEVVSAMPVDDRYKFLIDDLLPGDYEIFAGTDMNNDGNICDAGELCGAFGGLSAPSIVHYADISDAIDVVIEVGASAEAVTRAVSE